MVDPMFQLTKGEGPLVAAAIHDGHSVRPELAPLLAISDADRLREEDPFTSAWTAAAQNRIVVNRSRFEVDLNRPRNTAVYIKRSDAWGLKVWKKRPPDEVIARSLDGYDDFYRTVGAFLAGLAERYGRFVVLDLHSYNHRRLGPDGGTRRLRTHVAVAA